MGFTGHLLVVRSEGPLEQAPMLASVIDAHSPEALVFPSWPARSGWQQLEVDAGYWDEDRPSILSELVAWTGAPACSAWVLDSDCAIVTLLRPGGRPWRTAVHLDTVAGYAEDDPEAVLCPLDMEPEEYVGRIRAHLPHAAMDLLAWAAAAGFHRADVARVEASLRSTSVFAEETWDSVLAELGLPVPRLDPEK